jgi:heme a synthase
MVDFVAIAAGSSPASSDPTTRRDLAMLWLQRLIFSMALETLLLMAVGSATRVMNAGLACPDWPLCYGELVPVAQMNLQVFLEWFHRLMASLMGSSVIALAGISFWQRRHLPAWLPQASLFALGLIVFQGVLGGLTVTQLLRFDIVTAHLGTALLFFLTLVAMGCALLPGEAVRTSQRSPIALSFTSPLWAFQATSFSPADGLFNLAAGATGLVYLQSLLGALVGSQWAVHQCLSQSSLCGVLSRHLWGAGPTTLACLVLLGGAGLAWRELGPRLRVLTGGILACLLLQLVLGVATLYLRLQVQPLTVAHQWVGACLLGSLMAFTVLARRSPPASDPQGSPELTSG